ncbi:hypothetical protein JTB14_020650 [Gonioctena quinquepunctata]|nr:hypothetical protein JTB14_020650 [Gonioctena quinquepunctata]
MAEGKTESIVVEGLRDRLTIQFLIGNTMVVLGRSMVYLGVVFDDKIMRFTVPVNGSVIKAGKRSDTPRRLMPNFKDRLTRPQRLALIQVASAYRTVSTVAAGHRLSSTGAPTTGEECNDEQTRRWAPGS